jgi:hypothetical protein
VVRWLSGAAYVSVVVVKLTRQQKAYAAVLGLAAVALIVDRAVLSTGVSGPRLASADLLIAPAAPATGRASAASTSASANAIALHLAAFARGAERGEVADAFRDSGGLLSAPVDAAASSEASAPSPTPQRPVREPVPLRLSTIIAGANAAALINSVAIRLGETRRVQIDARTVEVTLIEVHARSVVVEVAGERRELSLP